MHCVYCNKDHRSLLEPDGGESCDPFGSPKMPLNLEELDAEIRKIQARKAV
jgi:hypothetical protein